MVLLAASQEADLDVALSEDCDAAGSLNLLQAKGEATALAEDEELKDQSVSNNFWQGNRETSKWCSWHSCPSSLGPTECHHLRCICAEDHIYTPEDGGKCVAKDSDSSARMTGKSCYLMGCSSKLGAVKCVNHQCLCWEGFTYQGGSCVSGQPGSFETTVAETTQAEMPAETTTEAPAPVVTEAPAPVVTYAPPPVVTEAPAAAAPGDAAAAACSAAPNCAKLGLAGDCCPNADGVRLGCC